MQEFWIIEVISFIRISAICGQHPALLISHIPPPSSSSARGWGHLLDHRQWVPFWEPSFTFGGLKSLMAFLSLFINVAGDIHFTQYNTFKVISLAFEGLKIMYQVNILNMHLTLSKVKCFE